MSFVPDKVIDGLDDIQDGVNNILDDVIPDIDIDIDIDLDDYRPSSIQKQLGKGADTIARWLAAKGKTMSTLTGSEQP